MVRRASTLLCFVSLSECHRFAFGISSSTAPVHVGRALRRYALRLTYAYGSRTSRGAYRTYDTTGGVDIFLVRMVSLSDSQKLDAHCWLNGSA